MPDGSEERLRDAILRDARLGVGWDESRGAYGLYDRGDETEWVIHAEPGEHVDDVDWPLLRGRVMLAALPIDPYRQALEDIAGHFLPGDERRTYGSATHTLDRIRDTVREALAE